MPKQRYRRLTDLFTVGRVVPMPDGSNLWVQAINTFERDEAISDAQVARARIILALKQNGAERIKVDGRLAELGNAVLADELARSKSERKASDYADEMRVDPEWKERMEIVLRSDWEEAAKPPEPEELALLTRLNQEVIAEFAHRQEEEFNFLTNRYLAMTDEELLDEWVEEWLDRRGSELATAEFRLTEMWYATRYCDAKVDPDSGEADHEPCEGHGDRVFESKADARSAPEELQQLIRSALDELNLSGRDPKGSDSPPNSSGSSPTPSEPGEFTPSTSAATPEPPPGTSPSLSPTP